MTENVRLSGSATSGRQQARSWMLRPVPGPVLRVESRQVRVGLEVMALVGEIDLATAPILRRALADCETRRVARVVVDTSGVSFLSAAGVGVLAEAAWRARGQQWHMSVVTGRVVRRVLELIGDGDRLVTYVSLAEALATEEAGGPIGDGPTR